MGIERLTVLKNKHEDIHRRIECMEAEKAPDEIIQKMKREKLYLKDLIHSMESELLREWDF